MLDGNGSALSTAVFTKAVVATCVVSVPALAVVDSETYYRNTILALDLDMIEFESDDYWGVYGDNINDFDGNNNSSYSNNNNHINNRNNNYNNHNNNIGSSGLMPLCLSPLAFNTFYENFVKAGEDPIMPQVAYKWISVLVALMVVPGTLLSPPVYNNIGLAGGCILGKVRVSIVLSYKCMCSI